MVRTHRSKRQGSGSAVTARRVRGMLTTRRQSEADTHDGEQQGTQHDPGLGHGFSFSRRVAPFVSMVSTPNGVGYAPGTSSGAGQ
jgi:hypothetical protein